MRAEIESRTERSPPRLRLVVMLGSVAIVIGALAIAALVARRTPRDPPGNVTLIYVGADDCAPCRSWHNDGRVKFIASSYFARIIYREVTAPHLEDVLKDEYWPEDLRAYRDLLHRDDGVPLWLILSDGKLIERRYGIAEWRDNILPRIKSIAR